MISVGRWILLGCLKNTMIIVILSDENPFLAKSINCFGILSKLSAKEREERKSLVVATTSVVKRP